jgi:acyl carrier protein
MRQSTYQAMPSGLKSIRMNNLLSDSDTKAVLNILIEQLGVQQSQLTADARLEEDLGADSLDKVEIIMSVDERFSVSVPDEIAERVSTVGDLCETLAELLAARERRAV